MRVFSLSLKLLQAGMIAVLALIASTADTFAQAPLFISPQRVELYDSRRSEVLTVTNRTDRVASYALTLEDYSMTEAGVTTRVDALEHSARRMIRFSPRQFVLQPGETQTIRVLARRTTQVNDGTYRTHLVFRESDLPEGGPSSDRGSAGGMSFGIGFRFNIAIPVVVAAGDFEGAIGVAEASVQADALTVKLTRSGNADAVGRVSVDWVRPDGHTEEVVPESVIRIYRERDWITKSFVPGWPNGRQPTDGQLKVKVMPESRSNTDVLDEFVVSLQ